MAANMTGMRVEETAVFGTTVQRMHGRTPRTIGYAMAIAVLAATLIGGWALHDRQASHPTAPIATHVITSAQTQFLENNTTNLPSAVSAETRPVIASSAQKFLDVNTTWLPAGAAELAPSAITTSQRRFLDVNTTWLPTGPSFPYMEDVTPPLGQPR